MTIRGALVQGILNRTGRPSLGQSQALPAEPGRVVFLGDGLALYGEWAEWLPDAHARVLGDEGMRIQDAQLIDRLDSAIESPLVISLLLGTNDLQRGNPKGSDSVASEFNAEYLDLWPVLATPERSLKSELTFDNLHLNAKGYRHWVEIPAPALEQVTTKD